MNKPVDNTVQAGQLNHIFKPVNKLCGFVIFFSLLARSISHLVSKIFCFLKNATEIPYDVIYSIDSVKDEYLRK